jgi:hypothetical protein
MRPEKRKADGRKRRRSSIVRERRERDLADFFRPIQSGPISLPRNRVMQRMQRKHKRSWLRCGRNCGKSRGTGNLESAAQSNHVSHSSTRYRVFGSSSRERRDSVVQPVTFFRFRRAPTCMSSFRVIEEPKLVRDDFEEPACSPGRAAKPNRT